MVENAADYHNSLCEILSELSSASSGSSVFNSKVFEHLAWIFGLLFTVIPLDEIDFYKLEYIKTAIQVIQTNKGMFPFCVLVINCTPSSIETHVLLY